VSDEKTSIQAKARINPTLPPRPGRAERREFEYQRNGTVVLFAGLNVHDGGVAGWVTDSTCSDNFVTFLWDLMDQTPAHLDLHCIVNNLAAHDTAPGPGTVGLQPSGASAPHAHPRLLAESGVFFSILERQLLRRGEFADVDDLAGRIISFIKDYNLRAAPFQWTYDGRPLKVA